MASQQKLFVLPSWKLQQSNETLLISGGADALYSIEDVPADSFFATIGYRPFTRKQLPKKDIALLEQLLSAGIVQPLIASKTTLKFAVIGDDTSLLNSVIQPTKNNPDYVIIVRKHRTFAELLQHIDYRLLKTPHLLVDLAYNHTISIGPLVFFGETACIACLEGRLGARWQNPPLPPKPAAYEEHKELAAQLVQAELQKLKKAETSLTNLTVEWDVQNRNVTKNKLFKVPFCPICSSTVVEFNKPLMVPLA